MTISQLDVQALALKAGLIVEDVEGSGVTHVTEGDFNEALTNFARLLLAPPLTEEYSDEEPIDPAGWYIVSSQGVEDGPWDTRAEAKAECEDECYTPMIGAEVIEMLDN